MYLKIKANEWIPHQDNTSASSVNESNGDNVHNQLQINKNSINSMNIQSRTGSNSLKFHEVCGKNILLNGNKQIAQRLETSFCDAIVFSSRSIDVYERVYIKIVKLNTLWNGMLRFGFTSVNPDLLRKKSSSSSSLPTEKRNLNNNNNNNNNIRQSETLANSLETNSSDHFSFENDDESFPFNLPKYVYPDLTNKKGYWAAALATEEQLKENDVIYFYVNSNGEIHFGINNKYKGKLLIYRHLAIRKMRNFHKNSRFQTSYLMKSLYDFIIFNFISL